MMGGGSEETARAQGHQGWVFVMDELTASMTGTPPEQPSSPVAQPGEVIFGGLPISDHDINSQQQQQEQEPQGSRSPTGGAADASTAAAATAAAADADGSLALALATQWPSAPPPQQQPPQSGQQDVVSSPASTPRSAAGSDGNCNNSEDGRSENYWSGALFEVDGRALRGGDHVWVARGLIQHHGVVTQVFPEVLVAHFEPSSDSIREVDIMDFACGGGAAPGELHLARYGESRLMAMIMPGAFFTEDAGPPEAILTRVKAAMAPSSAWNGYSAILNNCEQFAVWAMTGKRPMLSRQSQRGLYIFGAFAVVSVAVAAVGTGAAAVAAGANVSLRAVRMRQVLSYGAAAALAAGTAVDVIRKTSVSNGGGF